MLVTPWYEEIFQRYGAVDLSLLPIGAYEPRWLMKENHMNPLEAVQAHVDLRSKQSVGIHYGCWQLTDEAIQAPIEGLQRALKDCALRPEEFITQEVGETRIYQGIELPR